MNIKELNSIKYSHSSKSKVKELTNAVFYEGYYLSNLKTTYEEGKPILIADSKHSCKYSRAENHNLFKCRTCLNLCYKYWRKIPIKDGYFTSHCGCNYQFPIYVPRNQKKQLIIEQTDKSDFELDEGYQSGYDYDDIDIEEEEKYITLAEYM